MASTLLERKDDKVSPEDHVKVQTAFRNAKIESFTPEQLRQIYKYEDNLVSDGKLQHRDGLLLIAEKCQFGEFDASLLASAVLIQFKPTKPESRTIEVLLFAPGKTSGGQKIILDMNDSFPVGGDDVVRQLKHKGKGHEDSRFCSDLADLDQCELYTNESFDSYFKSYVGGTPAIYSSHKSDVRMKDYENKLKDKDGKCSLTCCSNSFGTVFNPFLTIFIISFKFSFKKHLISSSMIATMTIMTAIFSVLRGDSWNGLGSIFQFLLSSLSIMRLFKRGNSFSKSVSYWAMLIGGFTIVKYGLGIDYNSSVVDTEAVELFYQKKYHCLLVLAFLPLGYSVVMIYRDTNSNSVWMDLASVLVVYIVYMIVFYYSEYDSRNGFSKCDELKGALTFKVSQCYSFCCIKWDSVSSLILKDSSQDAKSIKTTKINTKKSIEVIE